VSVEAPADVTLAANAFLAASSTSSPYQDPAFCGPEGPFTDPAGDRLIVVRCEGGFAAVGVPREVPYFGRRLGGPPALVFSKGPVIAPDADLGRVLAAISAYAASRNAVYCEIQPQWTGEAATRLTAEAARHGFLPAATPAMLGTSMIDLTQGLDRVFDAFSVSTRRNIRRAGRLAIRSELAASTVDATAIHHCIVATAELRGFAPPTLETLCRLQSLFRRESSRGCMVKATLNGRIIGGIAVCRSGTTAEYIYGGMLRDAEFRFLPIAYGLHWHAISWAAAAGCERYHMGGYDPEHGGGVARFKGGFGGNHARFLPPFRKTLRPVTDKVGRMLRLARARVSGAR
jgi:hypothetical protein